LVWLKLEWQWHVFLSSPCQKSELAAGHGL